MTRIFFTLSFCLLFSVAAHAQQQTVSGYVKDSLTHLPVVGATVSNPAKKEKIQTDSSGFFRLPVSPGDLVYAIAGNYNYDTIRYSPMFRDSIAIYLSPVNVMEAVTIETGYNRYQQDSLQRRRDFEASGGHKMKTVDPSSQKPYFGLTINLDRIFKKKYKDKKKDEQNFEQSERSAYVRYRFSPQLVSFYTGLKGESLLQFMQLYTPSYEWLRQHLYKEQLLDYLGEKLETYRSNLLQQQKSF